jgi:starch-binding outer membrane protein, SusD/RagB family
MKTVKKYIFIIAAFTSLLFAGCSKDFLDIKPAGKVGELSFFTDTTNIELMVNGVYSAFLYKDNCDVYDLYRWWLGSVTSDEAVAGGQFPTQWGEQYAYDVLNYTSESYVLKDVYGTMFNGIARASEVIEKLPEARPTAGDSMKKKIDLRLAECRFLRAAYYFVLARSFGGVPVVDHILLPSEYTMPRGTIKDVYNQMEKDLKAAIPYLPLEYQIPTAAKWRVSKGAAQALLAKMYIYESSYYTYYGANDVRMGAVKDRWKEAYDLCQEIINTGKYELVGANGETYGRTWGPAMNGFRFLFSVEGNNNKESIFAIQHRPDNGYNNYSYGTAITEFVGANVLFKKNGTRTSPDGHHWGYWAPTHKLYNLFDTSDVRRKVAIGHEADAINSYPRDSVYSMVDNKKGWYIIAHPTITSTNLVNLKYEIGPFASMLINNSFQGNPENQYYIRYADVILMASESAMMLNDQANASIYFNMIRARARNCGDGIHPADLTGTVTKQEIMDERAREFALEGERFFDLVRWKEAYNALNGSRMEWWDVDGLNPNYSDLIYQDKYDFYPLPAFETAKNSNLKQYNGW